MASVTRLVEEGASSPEHGATPPDAAPALRGLERITLSPHRLSDAVFDILAGAIATRQLPPGTRLALPALSAELGVSRMPVRDALLRLEQIGLVELAANRFSRVTPSTRRSSDLSVRFACDLTGSTLRYIVPELSSAQRRHLVEDVVAIEEALGSHRITDVLASFSAGIERLAELAEGTPYGAALSHMRFALMRDMFAYRVAAPLAPDLGATFERLRRAIQDGEGEEAAAAVQGLQSILAPADDVPDNDLGSR
ncbi:GntR family transcriptional regulator [Microbacterium resistens]|uniref:GntR family transcriptional regulator n=1 Tax=Microbacterium resistens TaxID=156977 RepID=A0ABY3RZ20_9MICO|nr:GntR family transcriptional regulator [Microbacterium resistens]UGS28328.1 GntR family transcriptional regulator [Microbacterium resistens]